MENKKFTKFRLSLELPEVTKSEKKVMVQYQLECIIAPLFNALTREVLHEIKIEDSRGDSHSFRNYDQIKEIYEKCGQITLSYEG